jgi:hypothetical protein
MIEPALAVEISLQMIAHRDHPDCMPLAERRRLDGRRGELMAAAVVVVQPEVILQGIGPDHIVAPLGEAKDDAARGIFPTRHRLESDGDIDVRVRASGRDDDVEGVLHGALDEHPLTTGSPAHLFHRPLAVHRLPALEARLLEVEALDRGIIGHLQLGGLGHGERMGGVSGGPKHPERSERYERKPERITEQWFDVVHAMLLTCKPLVRESQSSIASWHSASVARAHMH